LTGFGDPSIMVFGGRAARKREFIYPRKLNSLDFHGVQPYLQVFLPPLEIEKGEIYIKERAMTTLRKELQKIIMMTTIRLEEKKAAPVNPKTAVSLMKIFELDKKDD